MEKSNIENNNIYDNNFYLMHKDIIVLSIKIEMNGKIGSYEENPNEIKHQPFGTFGNHIRLKNGRKIEQFLQQDKEQNLH